MTQSPLRSDLPLSVIDLLSRAVANFCQCVLPGARLEALLDRLEGMR